MIDNFKYTIKVHVFLPAAGLDLNHADAILIVVTMNDTMSNAFMIASGPKKNTSSASREVIQHTPFPYVGLS